MDDKLPIILLDESEVAAARKNSDMNIIDLRRITFGEPLDLHIGVRDCPATLAEIVPMARSLSSKLMQVVLEKLDSDGTVVPCRRGCAICCNYLVFLSVPEAFRMVEEVMMMPLEQRQDVIKSCRQLAQRFREKLNEPANMADTIDQSQEARISNCYYSVKQACPFLCNNLCTIYEQRPVICREHIVVGSASQCSTDGAREAMDANVKIPVSMAEVLWQLTIELENRNREAVVLPCVFDWYEGDVERSKRTWHAPIMAERFINILLRLWR